METSGYSVYAQSEVPTQVTAPSGKPLFVNRAWQDLWAVSDTAVREVHYPSYNILTDPLMLDLGIRHTILDAFSGKTVEPFPVPYEPKKFGYPGRSRWVLAKLQPTFTASGQVKLVIVTFRDLTPERENVWGDVMSDEFRGLIQVTPNGSLIAGTRIRPLTIFRLLKIDNEPIENVRVRFPELTLEQIEEAVRYCQSLATDDEN